MTTVTTQKRNTAIEVTVENGILSLAFSNGNTLRIDPHQLSEDIVTQAVLHGLKQKLVDAAAIARNPDTGRSATIEDKYAAVLEVYNRITHPKGTWNKNREGGTGGGGSLLARALVQVTGKTREAVDAYLAGKTDDEKKALRNTERVAVVIAQLKAAATATKKVDTDALLGELAGD